MEGWRLVSSYCPLFEGIGFFSAADDDGRHPVLWATRVVEETPGVACSAAAGGSMFIDGSLCCDLLAFAKYYNVPVHVGDVRVPLLIGSEFRVLD